MALLVMAVALIVSILIGVGVWAGVRPSSRPSSRSSSFTLPEGQSFTGVGRQVVAISPDGTKVVYQANSRLYLRSLGDLEPHVIPGSDSDGGLLNPIFAPDGQSIAYFAQSRDGSGPNVLRRIPITGGTPSTMASLTVPFGASWGSEGVLVGQGRGGIVLVSPTNKAPERVVSVAPDEWAHGPQMLPGGRTVLFTLAKGSGDDRWENAQSRGTVAGRWHEACADSKAPTPIFAERTPGVRVRGTVFVVSFDAASLTVTGTPCPRSWVSVARRGCQPERLNSRCRRPARSCMCQVRPPPLRRRVVS
jgi:serine/threonine-protein kinase